MGEMPRKYVKTQNDQQNCLESKMGAKKTNARKIC